MAIALRRTIDNVHPDPSRDAVEMCKAGDLVAVGDDGLDWSGSLAHGFEIVNLPGTADQYRDYIRPQIEPLHTRLNSGLLKTNPALHMRLMSRVQRNPVQFLRYRIDSSGQISDKEND
ncbi:MAG: hypothetical protein ACU843_07470 [Gammaproteobacteria bacterium]